jgi:CRP/FNR family transcriptional regulator
MFNFKKIPFFSKFNDNEINKLKKNSNINYYNPEDVIYYEGEKPIFLYVLLEGSVDVYKTNLKGKQLYIHMINAIDFLGEVAVLKKIPYPTTVECATKCKILKIDYSKMNKDFCEKLFFCQKLVESLYKRIMILMNVLDNSFLTTQERVAKLILNNVNEFSNTTYTDVAKKLNMTPETLSRILNKLKKLNYIDIEDNHKIKIISKNNLIKLSE